MNSDKLHRLRNIMATSQLNRGRDLINKVVEEHSTVADVGHSTVADMGHSTVADGIIQTLPENKIEVESFSNHTSETVEKLSADSSDRTSIVLQAVNSMFDTFKLVSLNASFFGEFACKSELTGYSIEEYQGINFLVKERSDFDLLPNALNIASRIRESLKVKNIVELPLVGRVQMDGAMGYSLIITKKEMQVINQTYPRYKFGIAKPGTGIDSLILVVSQ